MRIASTSGAGAHFAFVLHRVKTKTGESTRVHLDWSKPPDAESSAKITQIAAGLEHFSAQEVTP